MNVDELMAGVDGLVSLPAAVIRVNELIDCGTADITAIANVISVDPGLSAQLLKLANSAFYNFAGQIDTVTQAIALIGTRELRSMIVASSAVNAFRGIDSTLIEMPQFWMRSVYCGLVAKNIAVKCRIGKSETLFLCGLLHDVGKLLLFMRNPAKGQQLLKEVAGKGGHLSEHEMAVLGFYTADLGAALLTHWRLPDSISLPIRFQHRPAECQGNGAQALHLAILLADVVQPELKSRTTVNFSDLDLSGARSLALSEEHIESAMLKASEDLMSVLAAICP